MSAREWLILANMAAYFLAATTTSDANIRRHALLAFHVYFAAWLAVRALKDREP